MNNAKWTWFAIGYQTVLAYMVSFCIYQLGTFIQGESLGLGTILAVLVLLGFLYLLLRPANVKRDVKAKGLAKA